jgi:hypothetical protein
MRVGVHCHASAALLPGERDPVPAVQLTGWVQACGIFRHHCDSIPGPSSSKRVKKKNSVLPNTHEDYRKISQLNAATFCNCAFAPINAQSLTIIWSFRALIIECMRLVPVISTHICWQTHIFYLFSIFYCFAFSGFGGLEAACWPLVPKFAGSNPVEAVGFFGRKNPQHAFLRRGSKAICPMSCFTACKRTQT